MPPRAMRTRCSAFRYCPDPLGIVTAKQFDALEFGELVDFFTSQNPQIHSVSCCKLLRYLIFATVNSCYNRISSAYELIRQIEFGAVTRNSKTNTFTAVYFRNELPHIPKLYACIMESQPSISCEHTNYDVINIFYRKINFRSISSYCFFRRTLFVMRCYPKAVG